MLPSLVVPRSSRESRFTERVSPAARLALLASSGGVMLIPSLDLAIVCSALMACVSFGFAVRWTKGRDLPLSLRMIRAGLGMFTVGIFVRVVEAGINGGGLVFPGIADAFTFPAYFITMWGVGKAVLSRHTTAKMIDVVDAAAISVVAITAAFSLSAPFLFSETIGEAEQIGAIAYSLVELGFLSVFLLLLLTPNDSVRSNRWFAVAGVYATLFDTLVNILYAYDQAPLVDQMLRTLVVPIVAYAMATSFKDYADFAQPGVRRQRQRWAIYGIGFAALAALLVIEPSDLELVGLVLFGILSSVRLGLGTTYATRLDILNNTQNRLAARMADADSAESALEAGLDACHALLPPDTAVWISSTETEAHAGSRLSDSMTLISSQDETLNVHVAGVPQPHEWAAVAQVADLLSFAVQAVSSRRERITAIAEADWRSLSGTDNELVFIVADGIVKRATPNATDVLGVDPTGRRLSQLLDQELGPLMRGDEPEVVFMGADNRWMSVTAQRAEADESVVTVRDATARVTAEFVDSVTGLNNMAHFASRHTIESSTLMVFRIDSFSRINDTLGKTGANKLLTKVGERMSQVFREGIDEVWRGDGPTFVALCRGSDHSTDWIARRRDEIAAPLTIQGHEGAAHIAITTVVVPIEEEITVDTALHRADITLTSRAFSDSGIARFTADIELNAHRRFRIEEALAAIDNPATAGFRVHYQPIIDAHDGHIDRVEALLRWTHATLGVVTPNEFIPAAERSGRVALLDQFVMETACNDLLQFWLVDERLDMQVNLSPVGLTPERIDSIAQWVRDNCPNPPRLTIEIIESAIGDEFEALVPALTQLREAGVGLAVDDYGTSESNFARLTRLPLTQVKLAGIFATDVHPDTVTRVVGTIHSMGYTCVVENVEETHQADAMQAAGADFLQGWLISKDLPADGLMEFLDSYGRSRSTI